MIEIKPVPAFHDNYIWLIIDSGTQTVAIVDPGDALPVHQAINRSGLTPVAILVTHHHPDHVNGIDTLLESYQIPVYGPAHESIPRITHPLHDNDTITLQRMNIPFQIMEVPGHTPGHIAYHGDGKLFIGDTLFMAGCGRLRGGTAAQLYHSINRVAKLQNDTIVYCTHEYTLANLRFAHVVEPDNDAIIERIRQCSALRDKNIPTVPGTLACEKATNPFLRTEVPAVILAAEKFAGHKLEHAVDVFANLRKWKDQF